MFRLVFLGAAIFCVVEATIPIVLPPPNANIPCSNKCNIYTKDLVWSLEDCICVPKQNPCVRDYENTLRISKCQTPLVPVTEELCKKFIPAKCPLGLPVIAQFPIPPACGCKGKQGTIIEKQFKNLCELKRYSALNKEAFISYRTCLLPIIKC